MASGSRKRFTPDTLLELDAETNEKGEDYQGVANSDSSDFVTTSIESFISRDKAVVVMQRWPAKTYY